MGYPVVTVQRDYSSATAALSQVKSSHLSRNFFRQINAFALLFCKKRFLLYSVSPTIDDTTYRWWIPLTYTSDFKETNYEWLSPNETEDSTEISLEQVTEDDWVIFNINQVGQFVTRQFHFLPICTTFRWNKATIELTTTSKTGTSYRDNWNPITRKFPSSIARKSSTMPSVCHKAAYLITRLL